MRMIDADKLREDVLSWENCYNGYSDAYDKARIIDAIDEQPTVDTERHGHWILTNKPNIYGGTSIKCSECGYEGVIAHIEDHHYCWVCGALMDEKKE